MSTNHAEEYADTLSDHIEEVMQAVREGSPVEDQDATEWLDEWPLEVVRQVGRQFEVVLTVGGPDARVVCDLTAEGYRWGSAKLEVHWGGDVARRYGSWMNDLADHFADYYAGME